MEPKVLSLLPRNTTLISPLERSITRILVRRDDESNQWSPNEFQWSNDITFMNVALTVLRVFFVWHHRLVVFRGFFTKVSTKVVRVPIQVCWRRRLRRETVVPTHWVHVSPSTGRTGVIRKYYNTNKTPVVEREVCLLCHYMKYDIQETKSTNEVLVYVFMCRHGSLKSLSQTLCSGLQTSYTSNNCLTTRINQNETLNFSSGKNR